jgi:hypothetical protein
MGKNSLFHNLLIINQLEKTTKIVPKMFGKLPNISYLCNISINNRPKL